MKANLVPAILAIVVCPLLSAQQLSDLTVPTPIPPGSTLVVGFLGGFDRWDDNHRSVRQLALKLGMMPGVYTASVSNHRRRVALDLILKAFDTERNHRLDPEERASARIVLYGQSWGGAAALETARDLERLEIPVLLTVQVDSVGFNDAVVPENVQAAVNFYQHDPLTIQGRREIRAADPAKTRILGNFGFSYLAHSVDESNASWLRRTFGGGHAKMELDPDVWSRVEQYITTCIARR
jgi:pimeloyl-ACP methyl ester carboxylesterase